ncbi:HigA family addiction module antitoxin [uncultured Sphaerochaeta sp.]|uniref:HigA family addiction module antitoxin n=1 Tax=uncultured Sphaerochaeta sp. TaxID=886478 RepID=UPI002A0A2D3C|nr:HigA family addiction module antitoxin [uncultured Sphaerochaeta sp.]
MDNYMPALTVGEFLKEEFMVPLGLSAYKLAKDIDVPVSRIQEILANRRKLSMDTALRLAHYFGASDEYFANLQTKVALEAEKLVIKKEIDSLPTYEQTMGKQKFLHA